MRLRSGLTLLPALALGACVAGPAPEIATPVPTMPAGFLYSPEAAEEVALAALLPENDPAFVALSEQALSDAPSLAEALARVAAARAGASRAGAERLPNVGADASVEFRRSNPAQFGGNLPAAIPFDTEQVGYATNLTARWDPDLFGVLKANERAALARLDAANASAQAVRIALVAEIAASVIDWRTLGARQKALEEDLSVAERLVELTSERVNAGLMPGFNRVRIEANASQSRTCLAALQSERAQVVGRLVTLTGPIRAKHQRNFRAELRRGWFALASCSASFDIARKSTRCAGSIRRVMGGRCRSRGDGATALPAADTFCRAGFASV